MPQEPGPESTSGTAGARPPASRRPRRGSIVAGVVAFIVGILFATNATLFRGATDRHPENLTDLVAVETSRLEAAAEDVEALRAEVSALIDAGRDVPAPTTTDADDLPEGLASGRYAVSGPGIVVRLWDAPATAATVDARPDDLVVHQGDLEAVMNALWSGGAEAMTIQGNRVTSRTAVRCVGSVLLMAARTYSPPYEVAVIGDPERLRAALDAAPGVQIYLQYVDALGLGWSVETRDVVDAPATDGVPDPRYATVSAAAPVGGV